MLASTHSLARVLPFREEHVRDIVAGWNIATERRQKYRYSLKLGVRFGSSKGMIVNVSSGGVLIASRHQPPVGELVEMRIEWPSLLDGRIPLQLIVRGRILRRGPSRFAAAFERHEFRTVKRSGQS